MQPKPGTPTPATASPSPCKAAPARRSALSPFFFPRNFQTVLAQACPPRRAARWQLDVEKSRSTLEALAREEHPMSMFAVAKLLHEESTAMLDSDPEAAGRKVWRG